MWFRGGTGIREVYSSVDQSKKTKKGLLYFDKFRLLSQSSCNFPRILKWRPKKKEKKRSSSKTFYEIRCESTKIMKKQFLLANSRAVNTNSGVLGLNLHSSSPEPVNFFGAQSSLGGAQFLLGGAQAVNWGARPQNAPPWLRAWKLANQVVEIVKPSFFDNALKVCR